jgi:hypothetical protein
MKFSSTVTWAVYVGFVTQALLVVVLLSRRLWVKLPFFTAYSIFTFTGTVIGYGVRQNSVAYFYTYWLSECAAIVLGLAVLYEVFRQLLAPHVALHKLAKLVFVSTCVVLAVLGATVVYSHAFESGQTLKTTVFVVEEAARVFEIGLLMFLFFFSSVFGLHWRRHEFGIALGLGIFVSVELVNLTMTTHLGPIVAQSFGIIRGITFDLSLLIWLGYILIPERVAVRAELPKRVQLEQWNQAMMELIKQ